MSALLGLMGFLSCLLLVEAALRGDGAAFRDYALAILVSAIGLQVEFWRHQGPGE